MRQNIKMDWLGRIIGIRVLFVVMSMFVCIFSFSCRQSDSSNESEKNILYFTKKTHNYSVAPAEEYTCTVLDDGIIELLDYSDSEGYLTGHVQKWKYEIVGEGTVRVLWESVQSGSITDRYIDIYTIDKDFNYSIKKDFMYDCLRYMLVGPENSIDGFINGYLIDVNGNKFFYNIDKSLLPEISINAISDYYFQNKEKFNKVEFIDQDEFLNTINYYLKISLGEKNPKMQTDEKSRLYYFTPVVSDGELIDYYYYLIAVKDSDAIMCVNDNVKSLLEILGDNWDKCY